MKRTFIVAMLLAASVSSAICDDGGLPQWMTQAQNPPPQPPATVPPLTPQERERCGDLMKVMASRYIGTQARDAALELARNRGCLR